MKPDNKKQQEIDDDRAVEKTIRNYRRELARSRGYPPESETQAVQFETTAAATPSQSAKVPETYSIAEAAAILKVSLVTVYRLLKRGKLRYLKSLRHKRIPKTELERFIKQDLG